MALVGPHLHHEITERLQCNAFELHRGDKNGCTRRLLHNMETALAGNIVVLTPGAMDPESLCFIDTFRKGAGAPKEVAPGGRLVEK